MFEPAELAYEAGTQTVRMAFAAALPPGRYWLRAGAPAADPAGNAVAAAASVEFMVADVLPDDDADGLPDDFEALLGMSASDNDQDNDGIHDGDEDNDGDGLSNGVELRLLGLNPLAQDTDGNGLRDDAEDIDADGLPNLAEAQRGTDPRRADTDSDGWPDEADVSGGSSPVNAAQVPKLHTTSQPGGMGLTRLDPAQAALGLVAGAPAPQLGFIGLSTAVQAQPGVMKIAPAPGTTTAMPPVKLTIGPPSP